MKKIFMIFAAVVFAANDSEKTGGPNAAALRYEATVHFSRELPGSCREHAVERFRKFRRDEKTSDAPVGVVFIGDSLVEGWAPLPRTTPHAALNRGISCDTTLGVHERLIRDVVAAKPRVAVILAGTNDLTLFHRLAAHDRAFHVVQSITSLAQRLQGHGIKPVVVSIPPTRVTFSGLSVRATNLLIRDVNGDLLRNCRRLGAEFWNIHRLVSDANGQLKEGFTYDGLHLSSDAYQHINRHLTSRLRALLR